MISVSSPKFRESGFLGFEETVLYRAMSILLAPVGFRKDVLGDRLLTMDEARQVLERSHQWFRFLFATEEGKNLLKIYYKIVKDAYEWGD